MSLSGPILVTGAAGFVGSHLLELLLGQSGSGASSQSTPIVGWRRPDVGHTHAANHVRWMDVELLDRRAVVAALAEVRPSVVFHLAGAAHVAQSWQNTRETYEGNVRASHNVFEALRELQQAPRVLVPGSATIYRSQPRPLREDDQLAPSSPYATSKLAQELLARHAWETDGLPVLTARAFNHVGPRQDPSYVAPSIARQIALIEAGREPARLKVGNLQARRDLTDVRDTVRAYVALMTGGRPAVPYNVSSGRAVAIGELVDAFLSRARCRVEIVQDPALLRPNDSPLLVGDHSRLSADTGWMPQIPFEQTIDDLLEYWRARVAGQSR